MRTRTKKTIYLAGAIDKSPDLGAKWRSDIEPRLLSLGFDIRNPLKEESTIKEVEDAKAKYGTWIEAQKKIAFSDYVSMFRKVVDLDIKVIDNEVDILLVYFDEYVLQGAGTHGEMTLGHYFGIPVYAILAPEFERRKIPSWDLGCIDKIFNSVNEAIEFLSTVNPTISFYINS